jgi:S-adenosylmethionine:tRNA ribosyltransferase-isomerase
VEGDVKPARWPRDSKLGERLMVLDPESGELIHASVGDLPAFLDAGDLVIVNDAATLPSALSFEHRGARAELRIASLEGGTHLRAILFGDGSNAIPTEEYGPAPRVERGDRIHIGPLLDAEVEDIDPQHPRLVRLRFDGTEEDVYSAIYRLGRPIQYSYVERQLSLFHVQTLFASRPWASEMPSAGRPLSFGLIAALRKKGIEVRSLTHGAGLSSTGDPTLDARLPLRERYDIPLETAQAVQSASARGARVVAIGTSVTRALEASVRLHGRVEAGAGWTELLIGPKERPRVVSSILTGMHQPGTSHYALLEGFISPQRGGDPLMSAWRAANDAGYVEHEFGDSMLVLSKRRERLLGAA